MTQEMEKTLGHDKRDVFRLDLTVEPYGEVKAFLDKRARETMYSLKAIANKVLSFEDDEQ